MFTYIMLIGEALRFCSAEAQIPPGQEQSQSQVPPERRYSHCLSLQHQILSSWPNGPTSHYQHYASSPSSPSWEEGAPGWCRVTFRAPHDTGTIHHVEEPVTPPHHAPSPCIPIVCKHLWMITFLPNSHLLEVLHAAAAGSEVSYKV